MTTKDAATGDEPDPKRPDEKSIELAIAAINKNYGPGSVMQLGDRAAEPWPVYPTGAFTLDIALGIGGLPKGRIVEIYGPESSGKTTIALTVIAEAQRAGERVAFIDSEHALDPSYAKSLGVDMDAMYMSQPDYGEMALDILDKLIGTGGFGVIVVDSVAALTPKRELDGEMGDSHVGLLPRLMSQSMRMINSKASKTGTLVIFINQIREKIGVMFGSPEVTPGGRALKFFSSVRLDIRRIENLTDTDGFGVPGVRTKVKVVKNKMAPPFRIAEFDILFGRGVNQLGCVLDAAVERSIIKKSGAWFSYEGEQLGQGRAKAIEAMASDLEMADIIKKRVLDLL